jgi:hypothetical protein
MTPLPCFLSSISADSPYNNGEPPWEIDQRFPFFYNPTSTLNVEISRIRHGYSQAQWA